MKPFYNLLVPLTGWTKLPAEGSVLHTLNLHCICISDRNPEIFQSLLSHISAVYKNAKFDSILCSLSEEDPLIRVFDAVKCRRIKGNYYLVNDGMQIPEELHQRIFYIESARI